MRSRRGKRGDDLESDWGEWMARAQEGDTHAYERLLLDILPTLRALVRGRLRDASLEEDVVQNVLVAIHRSRHTYRRERPFGAWLRAIARNAVVDAQRSLARRAARELAVPDPERHAPVAPPATPRGDALSPRVERALRELPASQRQAVELIHLRQWPVAQAAAALGLRPGALRVRAHRGYRALRALLGRPEP